MHHHHGIDKYHVRIFHAMRGKRICPFHEQDQLVNRRRCHGLWRYFVLCSTVQFVDRGNDRIGRGVVVLASTSHRVVDRAIRGQGLPKGNIVQPRQHWLRRLGIARGDLGPRQVTTPPKG